MSPKEVKRSTNLSREFFSVDLAQVIQPSHAREFFMHCSIFEPSLLIEIKS
jgi:hypothetical protein